MGLHCMYISTCMYVFMYVRMYACNYIYLYHTVCMHDHKK